MKFHFLSSQIKWLELSWQRVLGAGWECGCCQFGGHLLVRGWDEAMIQWRRLEDADLEHCHCSADSRHCCSLSRHSSHHIYHPLTICFEGISPLLSTIFKLSNFILNCTQCRCWEDGGSCKCEVKMMIMPRLDDVNHQEAHCLQSIGGHTEIFYLSVS